MQNITIQNPVITTNLPFGDACFTPTGLCVDLGVFTQNVTIPDNPNGYFLEYQICCRNAGITNLANPTNDGMTFYCEIPDPGNPQALNNSNPDMGTYPLDAYFCVNSPKMFQFNVTDADNDSLVYSLVAPLNDGAMAAPPTFPYADVIFAGGYNVGNMIGGTPMTINPTTGMITANPALIGTYVFGVRVEEYRNGVKIGETRIDAQYEALACTSGNPPMFQNLQPTMGSTLNFPYNKELCKDLIFTDINVTDTLYIEMISPIFDSAVLFNDTAFVGTMVPDGNGDYTYFFDGNYNAAGYPSSWNDSITIPPNQTDTIGDWNIGTVATRFCWTAPCISIDSTYPFQVNAFSLGCDGKSQDSILFNIYVVPPEVDFKPLGDKEIGFGAEYCRNIVFHDTSLVDNLNITVTSEIFNMGAEFPVVGSNYDYENWQYSPSTYQTNMTTTGVPNNASNTQVVATRFCWTPDCEHIGGTFPVSAVLSSTDCPEGIKDTIDFELTVVPPFDSLDVIPNVITPNCDGLNDYYTLGYDKLDGYGNPIRVGGTSNPCHDEINIQIFNRWGNLVYESEEYPEFKWYGRKKGGSRVAAGTYFVLVSGTYGNETVILEQRSVTVLDPQECPDVE